MTIGEFTFRMDFGIDQFLFKDTETPRVAFPGRTGLTSAINFVFVGVGLYVLTLKAWKQDFLSQTLALIAGTIAIPAFIGHLYDVESLHRIGTNSHMALHSAMNFIMLAVGIC